MPFGNFADYLNDLKGKGETLFAKVKDKNAFNRLVATCYLIASADGDFDADEKTATAKLIQKNLPQYQIKDIVDCISDAQSKTDFDMIMGRNELLDMIAKAGPDEGRDLINAAVFIGGADGEFDDDEKAITKQICSRLNLSPADYGL